MDEHGDIIIYQTEDGLTKIEVSFEYDTVWLSKSQMAELFQRDRSVISKHIKNVFEEGELSQESNVQNLHIANMFRKEISKRSHLHLMKLRT